MNHNIENEVLTIYLEGELNSFNSEEVKKEIDSIIDKGGFSSLKLDLGALRYISSAGLRVIIAIKQRVDNTSLRNVSDDVYNIFQMVGFPNLLKIERK